ncbi:MAG: phage major capsid protein [Bacteroidales bacterium]|nr:phage major capsid protein [Candidatus Colimorpha merdihippi]
MAVDTTNIPVPDQVADEMWAKVAQNSAVAALAGPMEMKYGDVKVMTFTADPVAELVGENAEKSPTPPQMTPKDVVPRKLQVTIRTSNEVMWADEDHKLGVFDAIQDKGSLAIARALDLVGIHKFNPLAGAAASTVNEGIVDTTLSVSLASQTDPTDYNAAIGAAEDLLIAAGSVPTGYAFDTAFANQVRKQKNSMGLRLEEARDVKVNGVGAYDGIVCASSNTISAIEETTAASTSPTGLKGIVGDWSAFKWGVQRDVKAELIEFGDPDGLGDLKRKNQVAIRLEVVYGIGIMDKDAFAKVVA